MKIIGSILIIISSLISSYFYEKCIKDDIEKLKDLIDLINFIKSKIEYFSISIEEIMQKYEKKNQWIESVISSKKLEIKHVDNNINKDINFFFSSLGKGYKKEQLSLCDYTLSSVSNAYENLKKESVKKAKIHRSLSLFCGIGVVILLL